MNPLLGLAVVVPAHDEQDVVLACLDAVATARDRLAVLAPDVVTTVVVALDACGDATAHRVATRPDVLSVAIRRRAVGAARAAGTAFALQQLALPPTRVWTAHTDADSLVPADWLTAMVTAADHGVDAVLGTVVPDDDLAAPVRRRWTALHPAREGHPHVHGANLGVRASSLAAVGGWRALRTGEDVDLADRLGRLTGADVLRTARIPVVTSSRRVARAPDGFATFLDELTVA